MPLKLKVLIGMMALSLAFSLYQLDILGIVLTGVLLGGVLLGNDGVRQLLRGLAMLNIVIIGVGLLQVMQAVLAPGQVSGAVVGVIVAVRLVAVAFNVYFIWALGCEDVRRWMFRKNTKLDELDIDS